MTVKVSITGIKETNRFLKMKNKRVIIQAEKGIKTASFFMQGEVKSSIAGQRAEPTSVDTGRFLNSVDFTLTKLNAIIFSMVPYARILEFGGANRPARRHFNNSLARNKIAIRNIINKQIKRNI